MYILYTHIDPTSLQIPIIDYIRVKTRGSSPYWKRSLFNENRFNKLSYMNNMLDRLKM